jgi:hypothetical protein
MKRVWHAEKNIFTKKDYMQNGKEKGKGKGIYNVGI